MLNRVSTIFLVVFIVVLMTGNLMSLDLAKEFNTSYKAEAAKNYKDAYKTMDNAFKDTKGDLYKYTIRMRMAYLDSLRNMTENAINNYRAASKIMKNAIEPHHNLQFIYLNSKKWKDLETAASDGLKALPNDYVSQSRLAYALFQQERYKEALAEYKKILESQPLDHGVRKMTGWCNLKLNNKKEAKQAFNAVSIFCPLDGEANDGLKKSE